MVVCLLLFGWLIRVVVCFTVFFLRFVVWYWLFACYLVVCLITCRLGLVSCV